MSSECPNGWHRSIIGDLLKMIRNGTTSQQHDSPTEFPVTRIETISDSKIDLSRVKYLNHAEPDYFLQKGDILYSHINSIEHMGKVAIFNGGLNLYHGMNLMLLRPDAEKVYPKFLFAYLSSDFSRAYARRECKSAINQASLGQKDIKRQEINLPSPTEQCRIIEILDTIDEAIQKTEELVEKLTAMKQGLLHDLLTRGLDKNGRLRDPKAHPEQFKNSALGRIPREWCLKPLNEVAVKIQDGTHFSPKSSNGPRRYITSKNVRFGYIDLSDCGFITRKEHDEIYSRCDVKYGDILLTKDGANTGNAAINSLREEFSLLSSVAFIRVDNINLLNNYLLQYLLSPIGQSRIKDIMSGLAITRLTVEKIRNFHIPIPSPNEQSLISKQLTDFDSRLLNEKKYCEKLKLQKKGLMHDLLTGKVRVKANSPKEKTLS